MSSDSISTSTKILQLEEVKKYYPIKSGSIFHKADNLKAVDGVNLEVYKGETLGIVGESGCGKSTIAKLVLRLESLTSGSIIFKGRTISRFSEKEMKKIRPELQMVFQDPFSSLNPRKRIYDILSEPIITHKIVERSKVDIEVNRLLDIVGLPKNFKNRFPHEFSGGQRQRIGIARALSLKPELIVCDEPVSALDVSVQAQILNLLKELQKEFKLTYIFIGHGLGAVKYISDRIAVMYLGKIMEISKTSELFNNTQHPYTKALLDASPVTNPHLRGQDRTVLQGEVPNPIKPPSGCRFHTRCPMAEEKCRQNCPELKGEVHKAACFKSMF